MTAGANSAAPVRTDDCSREPIHHIGQIQSSGLLFALSESDFIIQQVSANIAEVLGLAPAAVLGGSFEIVLGAAQFTLFCAHVNTDDLCSASPLRMFVGANNVAMNCLVHRYDGALIAEFEILSGTHSLEPVNVIADIQIPLSRMDAATDVVALSTIAAREVRRLSGFDRVMVYRFDDEWNGEVIAEASAGNTVSYLGLRFPSSDIPPQARRLFLANPLRAIADVDSQPVPIMPAIGPRSGRPLDLTRSFLRSASALHIEYLRNMKVGSSLTASIVVSGRLWGMIACHHAASRPIDSSVRAVCELIGRMFASQIATRLDRAALQERLSTRALLENYMAGLEASTSLFDAQPFESARLLELFDADGLISRIGGFVFARGTAVPEGKLEPVIRKLRKFASRGIASSNMLSALDASAEAYAADVSGALYLGFAERSGDYLLLLRRELVETLSWAGNPDKAVDAAADGSVRPRKSFAAWQETVRFRSRLWTEEQLESARFLREQLLRLRELQR